MSGGTDHVDVAGLRIAFERAGEGPPLVLLHGTLGDSREWRGQLDDLSDEFTVVAWDAPGCGRSSDPPEAFGLHGYADSLAAFIEALGLGRAHVLGLSFGGGLALELYRQHPRLPTTLILAAAYAGWAGSLPPDVVEQRLRRALRDADRPAEDVAREFSPELFTKAVAPQVVDDAEAMIAEFHPAGLRAMAHAFAEADLRDVLPRIEVPTLLLYGDADQRAPLDVADDLHSRIPASTLVIMPGVGHQSNMEAPERFNDEVRSFLRSAQAPATARGRAAP